MQKQIIGPANVNLLIFDLDGTILVSTRPMFEAIKKAFVKLNLRVEVTEKEIEKYFRVSSDDFYQEITPGERRSSWREIQSEVRKEFDSSLRDFGHVFPGVTETLEVLKRRGYRLSLYSNSSIYWFNSAIMALGIREYFDYCACLQEINLTKTQMVQKIKSRFGNLEAAVIGDRIHDVEAARENNALSVGVLYGYGGEEPKQGDFTIRTFSDLLSIFDRRSPVFEKVLLGVKRRKRNDRAFIIGVTGIDASGKTKFAKALANFANSKGYNAQLICLDDFHNPREIRYSGEDQAENYYQRSFDIATVTQRLLIPIHNNGRFSINLTLLNLYTNKYEVNKGYSVDESMIMIFEGVFLFRRELSPYLDYRIFLEIPFEESKRRAAARDIPIYGEEILERYDRKYLPAQRRYLEEYPPLQTADMIINNFNWECPAIKYMR